MSGSVIFSGDMVSGEMTLKRLLELDRELDAGTRCLAVYDIKLAIFAGKATLGWTAGNHRELTAFIGGLPDKTTFILDDKLYLKLSLVLGQICYQNM